LITLLPTVATARQRAKFRRLIAITNRWFRRVLRDRIFRSPPQSSDYVMNQKRPSDPGAADGARLDPSPMDNASAAVLTPKPIAAAPIDATLPMAAPVATPAPGLAYGIPAQIGRYQVLDRVGQGGMGVLYRAIDPTLDREVAIKLMIGDFADDLEQLRPRFEREARAIARLQHRNIVTVFEFADAAGTPYIVMEFLRGTSLSARAKADPPLTIVEKLDIVAQLCDGLGYAHDQGIVHRDVKPANIFLLGDGSVKLLDFGIAKLTTSNLTRQGDVLGSPAYMSPEQIMGADTIDGRSDVFSAGVVLYELLAGRRPFEGDTTPTIVMKILNAEPPSLDAIDAAIPAPVAQAVARALEKEPAKRFATATDFARELHALRRSLAGELTPLPSAIIGAQTLTGGASPSTTASSVPPRRTWPVVAGIGGAVVAAAVLLAIGVGRSTSRATEPAAVAKTGTQSSRVAVPAENPPASPPAAPIPPQPPVSQPTGGRASAKPPAGKEGAVARSSRDTTKAASGSDRAAAAGPARGAKDAKTTTASSETTSRAAAPASAAAQIAVNVEGAYPFAIFDGSRSLSPASTSHHLTVPAGRRLRLVAPQYSLNQSVVVEENADRRVDIQAPALGRLTIRSSQETCAIKVGDRDLGYPPVNDVAIAGGSYQINLVCPDGRNHSAFVNIVGGQSQRVIVP
jgi:serine/threonine protein kinase